MLFLLHFFSKNYKNTLMKEANCRFWLRLNCVKVQIWRKGKIIQNLWIKDFVRHAKKNWEKKFGGVQNSY